MQNWSILAKFPQKNPARSADFYWLFLGEVSPRNFLWHWPVFLTICPKNPSKFDFFSAKILRNRPIFLRILTFLPRKSRKIGRFLRKFWRFSQENPGNQPIFPRIMTFLPAKLADFSTNFPLKIPRNFAFFSAKYQKPWYIYYIHTEKYSPKSYVVHFHTQMNSIQSDEWTMVFTCEENDTSNKNREQCFFFLFFFSRMRKMICPIRRHWSVWVLHLQLTAPFAALIRSLSTRKVLLEEFFS